MRVKLGLSHRLKEFESRILRTFEPPKNKIIRGWRKFYNREFQNVYSSQNIIRMIKSQVMLWVGHGAYMGKMIYYI
jgi:hypothetical protein